MSKKLLLIPGIMLIIVFFTIYVCQTSSSYTLHTEPGLRTIEIHPHQPLFAVTGASSVRIYNSLQHTLIQNLNVLPYPFSWSPDGMSYTAVEEIHEKYIIKLYSSDTYTARTTVMTTTSFVDQLLWSPDGETLAIFQANGMITLWDRQTHTTIKKITAVSLLTTSIAWSPNSMLLAYSDRQVLKIWDREHDRTLMLGESAGTIASLAWSSDGRYLAMGAQEYIRLWETRGSALQEVQQIPNDTDLVTALVFVPDSHLLVSGTGIVSSDGSSQNPTIRFWDIRKTTPVYTLNSSTISIESLGFSSDTQLFFAATPDGTIEFWNWGLLKNTIPLR